MFVEEKDEDEETKKKNKNNNQVLASMYIIYNKVKDKAFLCVNRELSL